MADPKILIRRSSTPNKVPTTTNLQLGELAINTFDGKLYLERDQTSGSGIATVIAVNPWNVGVGSLAYDTYFTAGNVGINTTSPTQLLDVAGDIRLRGAIYDSNNTTGTANQVLVSRAGAGITWANLTAIPVGDANTLDGLDSSQFLRSDAADTKTGITTFSDTTVFDGGVELNGNITTNVTIVSTDAGSSAAPEFKLYRNSASPANADYIGQIKFAGESDTGAERNYAKITGKIGDATNGTEDGIIEIAHIKNGSQNISARWNSSELQLLNGTELSLGDSQKIYLGDGNDLQIYHDGSNSYIDEQGIGDLILRGASDIKFMHPSSGETYAIFNANGASELYYDNSKKFETTGFGVTVSGGLNVSGVSTFQDNAFFGDNDVLNFGDGNDLQIHHNGSYSYIKDTGTGGLVINADALYVKNASDTEALAYFVQDSAVSLYFDNSKKFETTSGGVTVTGNVTADGLRLGDSDFAYFGDGNDLQIYHDGSNSIIRDVGTGNLDIRGANAINLQNNTASESYAIFNNNGAVELYYDNSKKFETSGIGVTIYNRLDVTDINASGIVTATQFVGDGSLITGLSAEVGVTTNTTNQAQIIPFAVSYGSTTGFGATDGLVFNPSSTRLGIGSDAPAYTLDVAGDINSSTDVKINGTGVLDTALALAIALG